MGCIESKGWFAVMRFLYIFVFLLPSMSFSAPLPKVSAPVSMTLDAVSLTDLARVVFGDLLRKSYVLEQDFIRSSDTVSVNFMNLSNKQIERMATEIFVKHGFDVGTAGGVLRIRRSEKDDQEILVYRPNNRSARYLTDMLQKLAGEAPLGTRGIQSNSSISNGTQGSQKGTAGSMIDKSATDQIGYMCSPVRCKHLRSLLASLDTPENQVILRAAVYEVGTSRTSGSAIQMAGKLFNGFLSASVGSALSGNTLTLNGGNFDAVLSALDGDSNFKVLSRPMLRVKSGSTAKFQVGSQVPVLGAISLDNNGNAIQSIDYKPAGTIFTVSPDVREEFVDLSVSQELSSFVTTTTGVNNSPTMLQRSVSSSLSIKPGEVVVFAGLTEDRDSNVDFGLFGFSLGSHSDITSSEVLVFIQAERI